MSKPDFVRLARLRDALREATQQEAVSCHYCVVEGTLDTGYRIYGPYVRYDEARAAHPGRDAEVVVLEFADVVARDSK